MWFQQVFVQHSWGVSHCARQKARWHAHETTHQQRQACVPCPAEAHSRGPRVLWMSVQWSCLSTGESWRARAGLHVGEQWCVSRQEAMKMCVVLRTGKHEHLDSRAWTAAQKHVHFPLKTGTRFNFNIYSYWCLATPKYIKEVYCKEYPRSKHGVEDQQVKFLPRFYFHLCLGPLCHQLQH